MEGELRPRRPARAAAVGGDLVRVDVAVDLLRRAHRARHVERARVDEDPPVAGQPVAEVGAKLGKDKPFDLVFHGGSGSTAEEIAEAVSHGVIKMNIDTDTQYAYTRPVADFMLKNYDGVLKVDGEIGDKKSYDPRAWGKLAEAGMAARIVEACEQLGSAGKKI